ncbi:GNAT family N-acetyltransferase [Ornithinibacillus halotolerans]|uniref:N-acetyltransferase YoaA n=1 Tax=Ornithinibacillus halotolerans TaxID=1274357 RepID=A0A916S561_9BACI|nr:GNAT family N-acetyltransferase [Ornithinibacillus halotolerans]GGA83386.1 putative N-acetyltransferase YoaA [Ornithinibacillus halotolerans]
MYEENFITDIPILETDHYLLRGVALEDSKALFPILSDKTTMKFITPHPVLGEEDVKLLITTYLTRFTEQKEIPWVIVHKESNEVIGQFRLHKLHLWHRKAEMGAVIREDFQRKGVMTEILQSILPFFFDTLKLNRLVGDIFEGNVGSMKLLEKFGFTKEGVLRDTDFDGEVFHHTVVYSMLRREYLENK